MRLTARFDKVGAQGVGFYSGIEAQGASIPPPVEGWDAVSPIAAMSPKRAVRMINWFPQPDWIELRRGYVEHCDTATGLPVETVAAYQGVSSQKLFAASDGSIFDVSGAVPSASVTGLVNSRFQYLNFATTGGNFLYMVNGADDPQYYNGTAWAVAAITGVAGTDIIGVNSFKNRLWFTLIDSSDAAYLPVDSIQGAAVLFPLGGLFTKGGFLMSIGTWSLDAGDGPEDYIVFVSSRGQVAIYSGVNPASDFTLVGVFDMGAPIGRRCLTRVGADIAIICIDGVVPLSRAMIFERAAVSKVALTERIQRVMNESARVYKDNFGWQLISYPRGTRAILNVPVTENSEQEQYVLNTLIGAWCRFTGMNANCWEILNDDLYFGGNTGVVYEADTGRTDVDATIRYDVMTAFNYFGVRGRQKRWMLCRPLLTTDSQTQPGIAFNVDFQTDAPISVPSAVPSGDALWDVAQWDDADWAGEIITTALWTSVAGIGYCASIRVVVDVDAVAGSGITLQLNGFDLTMETGAFV